MYWIYNVVLSIFWIGLLPCIVYWWIVETGFYSRMKQSMGILPTPLKEAIADTSVIWIHAASVGEVVAASPIVKELKQQFPHMAVVVSVVTKAGHGMATRIIEEADGIIFFPLDFPIFVKRLLCKIRPIAILLVETELWPNFLHMASQQQIPIMMVNGRISDRSVKRYKKVQSFTDEMLGCIDRFCMQSAVDRNNILQLGVNSDTVVVTGNTKYDQTYGTVSKEEQDQLRREFGFTESHPIIIAGSTHEGEELSLLIVFKEILAIYPKAKLLIAPRQIIRGKDIQSMAEEHQLSVVRRSIMTESVSQDISVVILDTIGELGRLYSVGDIVFVGGSLIPRGGHNILEPASHGKPIIVGPHMFNFKEIYSLLQSRAACTMVQDEVELLHVMLKLCEHEELRTEMSQNCLTVVAENRGATARNIEEVRKLLN